MADLTYDLLQEQIQAYLAKYDDTTLARIPWFISLAELTLCRLPKHLGIKRVVVGTMTKQNPVLDKPAGWRSTVSLNYGVGAHMTTASRSSAAGVRTLYFTTPHPFSVGDQVDVRDVASTTYNGTALTVTSTTPLSITYSLGSLTEAQTADTSGYVTLPENTVVQLLPRGYEACRDYWPDSSQYDEPLYYSNYDYDHYFLAPTPAQDYPFELVYYEKPTPLSSEVQTNYFTQRTPDALLFGSLLQAIPYLKNDDRIPTWQQFYKQAVDGIEAEALDNLEDAQIDRTKGK